MPRHNATPAPVSRLVRGIASAVLLVLPAFSCKEAPPAKDTVVASEPPAIDTSIATLLGVAVSRPDGAGWCAMSSHNIGTGRPVKFVFMTARKIVSGKLATKVAGCVGGDTLKGANAWEIDFASPVPVETTPAIMLRDDVWGNINSDFVADFDLNGDQLRDTITVCTNGTVARFKMKWAGNVERPGWAHEVAYTNVEEPRCADAPAVVADVSTGILLPSVVSLPPSYELPYDREWFVLRTRNINEETQISELLKTTVLPMNFERCGGGVGRRLIAASAPDFYNALLANIPGLKEGRLEMADRNRHGGMLADSIRMTLKGKTLLLRREPVGTSGFRIVAEADLVSYPVFETPSSDLGRFYDVWAGDLDRDGEIDVLYYAQGKSWQDVLHLLLSSQRTPLSWKDAATYTQKPC